MENKIVRIADHWSEEDRRTAYDIYADPKQGNRSFRRTAKITGIPFQTLSRWNVTEGWQARLWKQDEREAMAVRQSVQMRLVHELDGLMDQLIEISHTGTNHDKTRLEAIKLGLAIASFSAVQKVEQDIIANSQERNKPVLVDDDTSGVTIEELSARLNEKLASISVGESVEQVDGEIVEEEED